MPKSKLTNSASLGFEQHAACELWGHISAADYKSNKIMKPLFEQIKKSFFFENKYLQEIRNMILPKLMDGEIEV